MPIYFSKQWHTGTNRDTDPGEVIEDCDWSPPAYRPGWRVQYMIPNKFKMVDGEQQSIFHVGKIRYILREGEGRLDFYLIIRDRDQSEEISFESSIVKRLKENDS